MFQIFSHGKFKVDDIVTIDIYDLNVWCDYCVVNSFRLSCFDRLMFYDIWKSETDKTYKAYIRISNNM